MQRREDMLEALGIGASIACLAHCLLMPVIIALVPLLSVAVPLPETFHLVALVLAIPATMVALYLGWRRHRLAGPLAGGLGGLALLAAAVLMWHGTAAETILSVLGCAAITAAHAANWRLRRGHCGPA
jgi:hypothetical protein